MDLMACACKDLARRRSYVLCFFVHSHDCLCVITCASMHMSNQFVVLAQYTIKQAWSSLTLLFIVACN